MKNPYIIPAAMICAAILAGFWMLKSPSEPQEVIVVKPPQPVQQPVQRTPGLLSMAAIDGDIQDIKLHIARGSDLNAKISDGIAPLHWAAFFGHKEIAELLIAAGADVNVKDDRGRTPMDMINPTNYKQFGDFGGFQARKAMADLIHKHGGKRGDELKAAEPVVEAPAISIHSAAGTGNIEAVKQHLADGADVNAKDDDEWTPLHDAANLGHKEIAELLIANGADVNAKDEEGGTPLHGAALMGHKEIVELLIAKGAEVNAKDRVGRTPLGWAISRKHTEIADLLRKHGGKTGAELKAESK